jgi:DNA-binding ferritin-like protein
MKMTKQPLKRIKTNKTKKYQKYQKYQKNQKYRSSNIVLKQYTQQKIVTMFLQMLNTVKLYHWKTTSYSQHKATDELYSNLNENIDSFVEIMLGKHGGRVQLQSHTTLTVKDYASTAKDSFKKEIEEYKEFLQKLTNTLDASKDSDLLNIRDEMLGQLNQFTYLFTLC